MEKAEFQKISMLEESHWWYAGLRELVLSSLDLSSNGTLKIMDAGCGTGGMLKNLENLGIPYGIDLSSEAIEMSKVRKLARIVRGSVTRIPFADQVFDWIISLDVLYHTGVEDEKKALSEFNRVLKAKGKLILNLPAFEFLRGKHDRAIHTRKRYTRNEIEHMLKRAGFSTEKISYRNLFLFPVILFRRFMTRNSRSLQSDLRKTPEPLNRILLEIIRIENRMLQWVNLPFGSSVFCIARKT